MTGAATPPRPAPLPPLYRRPRPLRPDSHAGAGLLPADGYGFAAGLHAVPLNDVELAAAARHYPIVFADADPPLPLAVLGLRQGQNLMLETDGAWVAGAYVPAYVRRYPFIFLEEQAGERLTLCVDEASDRLADGAGEPLFVDGQLGEPLRAAAAFCAAFQRHHVATRAFAAALQEAGLLVPRAATVRLADGGTLQLGGFRLLDVDAFEALPDATFLDWRRRAWLPLIYAHLVSAGSWSGLADRIIQQGGDDGDGAGGRASL